MERQFSHLDNIRMLPLFVLEYHSQNRIRVIFKQIVSLSNQEARFQLGPLFCSGEEEEEESRETDSCLALWRAGDTQAGYRMVRGHTDTFPKVGCEYKSVLI